MAADELLQRNLKIKPASISFGFGFAVEQCFHRHPGRYAIMDDAAHSGSDWHFDFHSAAQPQYSSRRMDPFGGVSEFLKYTWQRLPSRQPKPDPPVTG